MLSRHRATLGALGALLLAAACGGASDARPEAGAPVVLSRVELRDLEERIDAPGELLAKNRAEIAAEVAGQVSEIRFEEGEPIERDAVMIEIDPERRELDLASAQAGVAEAEASQAERRRELERVRALAKRQVASKSQLEGAETALATARSRLLSARARLGGAERALRDSSVAAPFTGLIARRRVSCGEYVQPGQVLFELVSLDPIEVEFHLAEVDSGRVRLGQSVEVRVAPYPEETFAATVSVVSPTIDPRTRTLRVKALLDNSEGRLRPGLFARVDLGIARRDGVAMLPEEAVLQRADGAVVFRLAEENRAERRVIETGAYRDGLVEVTAGLSDGDTVIRRGHTHLVDGSLVEARNPDGSPAVSAPRGADEGERTAR
jgi:membrane fusion protein (multidrug efflux system)